MTTSPTKAAQTIFKKWTTHSVQDDVDATTADLLYLIYPTRLIGVNEGDCIARLTGSDSANYLSSSPLRNLRGCVANGAKCAGD